MIWPEWYRVSEGEGGMLLLILCKNTNFCKWGPSWKRANAQKERERVRESRDGTYNFMCVCEWGRGGVSKWRPMGLKVIDESTLTEKLEHQKSAEHNNNNYKKIKNKKYVGCVRRPAVMLVTDAPERTFLCRSVFLRRGQNQREIRPVWLKGGCVRREEAA